jgi:hypothetical protein
MKLWHFPTSICTVKKSTSGFHQLQSSMCHILIGAIPVARACFLNIFLGIARSHSRFFVHGASPSETRYLACRRQITLHTDLPVGEMAKESQRSSSRLTFFCLVEKRNSASAYRRPHSLVTRTEKQPPKIFYWHHFTSSKVLIAQSRPRRLGLNPRESSLCLVGRAAIADAHAGLAAWSSSY